MDNEGSVTRWLGELVDGDTAKAQEELWKRYFHRLVGLARKKLGTAPRRSEDEEDVALCALNSFFTAAKRGRYAELHDRTNLWPLLVRITERKAINQRLRQLTAKRGKGQVRGESVFFSPSDKSNDIGMVSVPDDGPSPEFLALMSEEFRSLLDSLDGELRTVAEMKLEGYTNAEIADKLDVVERTIERKLKIIRKQWSDKFDIKLT